MSRVSRNLLRRLSRREVALPLAVLLLAGGFWWYRLEPRPHRAADRRSGEPAFLSRHATPPPDPRLTVGTPYRNVRPEVQYAGDAACARCHKRLTESYRQHPMGRSLAPIAQAADRDRYGPETHNPFEAFNFLYSVTRQGDEVVHATVCRDRQQQPFAERRVPISYVLGSGARGHSYLEERDGYLFQSLIGWYAQAGRWDVQQTVEDPFLQAEHFGRPLGAECLGCHANAVEPVEQTTNRYRQPIFRGHAIGCERCHGPGELHVRRREQSDNPVSDDDTIVHPGKLAPALREAVCEQCHLLGEVRVLRRGRQPLEFRPGLPLEEFRTVFASALEVRDEARSVGQVEQMYSSRCFHDSQGRLGCVSCHDPHRLPAAAERVAFYRGRCLQCHAERGCSLPQAERLAKSPADSCMECHMPKSGSSNVPHTANTDHRIVRRAGDQPTWRDPPPRLLRGIPLLLFHPERAARHDPELDRDLGLALIQLAQSGEAQRQFHVEDTAAPLLERSLTGDDLAGGRALGYAWWLQGKMEPALSLFIALLAKAPYDEETLALAAQLAGSLKRWREAADLWQRALAVNPYSVQYLYSAARARLELGDADGARQTCLRALELNPAHFATRELLVRAARRLNDQPLAEREFQILLRCARPDQREPLHAWFGSLR